MENENTNTPSHELITSVPGFETHPVEAPVEAPALIEMPEAIMPFEQRRQLGDVALSTEPVVSNSDPVPLENGRFGRGIVPVETPGPQAYNQASANGTLPPDLTIRR